MNPCPFQSWSTKRNNFFPNKFVTAMMVDFRVALASAERGQSKERILKKKLFDIDWITKQWQAIAHLMLSASLFSIFFVKIGMRRSGRLV